MGFSTAVFRALVAERSRVVVTECRHCGTSVDQESDRCPACGATELSRYQLQTSRSRRKLKLTVVVLALVLFVVALAGLGVAAVAAFGV